MKKVFIDGEAGTTGLLIQDQLKNRNDIELISIAQAKRKDVSEREKFINHSDVTILCLPDDAAIEAVALKNPANNRTKFIDASTAFRTNPDWAYGFAELDKNQRRKIAKSQFISNPGCWPQGLISLIKPLISAEILPPISPIYYHGISGFSGGGKKMIADYLADPTPASFAPYALKFSHKHLPEMKKYSGLSSDVFFSPAVGNYERGMLTQIPLHLQQFSKSATAADIHQIIAEYFAHESFIEVAPLENTDKVAQLRPDALNHSNKLRLHVFYNQDSSQILLMSLYDNLGKGASGSAIQNLNILLDTDETLGLGHIN